MPTMNALDVARVIAAELRAHPERWTQGAYARNAQGASVYTDSPEATCWCLYGHIMRVLKVAFRLVVDHEILSAFEKAALGRPFNGRYPPAFEPWQDERQRTVQDILAVCERVARLRGTGRVPARVRDAGGK